MRASSWRCGKPLARQDLLFVLRSSARWIRFAECRRKIACSIVGGAGGVRTRDLLDAIEARSQLRYGPTDCRSFLQLL
jgi:hypothetical protein